MRVSFRNNVCPSLREINRLFFKLDNQLRKRNNRSSRKNKQIRGCSRMAIGSRLSEKKHHDADYDDEAGSSQMSLRYKTRHKGNRGNHSARSDKPTQDDFGKQEGNDPNGEEGQNQWKGPCCDDQKTSNQEARKESSGHQPQLGGILRRQAECRKNQADGGHENTKDRQNRKRVVINNQLQQPIEGACGGQEIRQFQPGNGDQKFQQTCEKETRTIEKKPPEESTNQGKLYKGSFTGFAEESVPIYQTVSCAGVQRGRAGERAVCEVNCLRMNIDLMPDVAYHYDVTIKPDFPKKIFHLLFDQCQKQHFGDCAMAFDGFNSCYTLKRLPEKSYVFDIEATDSTSHIKTFKIHIKESGTPEVDLSSLRTYQNERSFDKPMRALQVLEVVLASNNHALGIRAGRSFYRKTRRVYDLGDCYEMCTGIYQVPLLGEVPLLNVDISYKSFPKSQSLIQCLRDYRIDPRRAIEGGRTKEFLLQFLKGIYITYSPPPGFAALPKTYKVLDIGDVPARIRFKPFGGPEISVMDYFQWKGCTLRYPDLNCIETINKISLPMEFCSITEDQVLNRKDGEVQATRMSAYAAISTNERKDKIMNLLTHFSHNENSTIKAFGVQLARNFVKINYRILQPPQLEYFNGKIVRPSDGAWQLVSMKFLETSKASQGHKWAIIFEKKSRSSISFHKVVDFKKALQRTSQELGVNLAEQCDIIDFQEIEKALEHFAKNGYALVVVIISSYGASYSTIKQKAELRIGVLTQCIKESTVLRVSTDKSIMTNLMLKINAKLNGTNHKVSEDREDELKKLLQPMRDIMSMGADVIQPSLDQPHMPSVVGVTASHDAYGACYNTQYSLQKSNVEIIEGMKLIAKKVLIVYRTNQGRYPNHIIYYRGGISAGQYPTIKKQELRGIREACAQLACGPLLTCIVVIKRHRTRFFPLLQAKGGKDFNNVQPGSVMDQYIVHPNERQFFLVSHKTIQGTARPTRYNVIQDDANFDIDLLQRLTYNMCHMSPRCNKALSYPAPAYLAHIAAFRARVYLEGATNFDNLKEENKKCSVQPSLKNRNPMFFV